ncbi:MAG: hypothetical protein AAF661_10930 [Pseudomonadota bacterium]
MKSVNRLVLSLLLASGLGAAVIGAVSVVDPALGASARVGLGWLITGFAAWTMVCGVRAVQTMFPALPRRAAWDWRRPIAYSLVLYVIGGPLMVGLYLLGVTQLLVVVFYVAPIVVALTLDLVAERRSGSELIGAGRMQL